MGEDSREENVYMAKLAEQAERYDEVIGMSAHLCVSREKDCAFLCLLPRRAGCPSHQPLEHHSLAP